MIVPLRAQETKPQLVIEIQRTMEAGEWGVVHVTDQFKILNNGTTPALSLDFGFVPKQELSELYYMEANDKAGKSLILEPDINGTSNLYWIRAHFAEDLLFNKTYEFTVKSVIYGPIRILPEGYVFNFTAAPVLAQDAKFANVTLVLVPATTIRFTPGTTYIEADVAGRPAAINEWKPWKAYSNASFYVGYGTVNQYLLEFRSLDRTLTIGNDGRISVADKYRLFNPSPPVTSLSITLPEGAYNVMAYDQVGAMWSNAQNPNPPYSVNIAPRYSLGIRTNESFTFTLAYDVPQSKYLKQLTWWGTYNLTFTFVNDKDDFLIQEATFHIVRPDGLGAGDLNPPPVSPVARPVEVHDSNLTVRLRGITSRNNMTFWLTFNYIPFWSGLQYVGWIVGLEIALLASVLIVRVRRRPESEIPVPVERLREFVGLYDERIALSRELLAMQEDVSRGALVKHEFRTRSKAIELRLDEVNKSLNDVKAALRAIGTRYDEMLRRIDRAEAEVAASRASMNQVRSQYRSGKTTRETYESLTYEIQKRIDRAEQTIEGILITMREEAR